MSHWNRHFKHLLENDIALLLDFLTDHRQEYQTLTYDVRVGPGRDPGPDQPPEIRQMALDLSRRRIDCLAETQTEIHVIEVCDRAGYRTIGQLPIYAAYYQLDHQPTKPLKIGILCRTIEPDLQIFCLKNAYMTWIYPPHTPTEP